MSRNLFFNYSNTTKSTTMAVSKPRVIKDFEKLEEDIQKQIKFAYPSGFYQNLISYVDKDGNKRMALPFETEEKYYLVRMTIQ